MLCVVRHAVTLVMKPVNNMQAMSYEAGFIIARKNGKVEGGPSSNKSRIPLQEDWIRILSEHFVTVECRICLI